MVYSEKKCTKIINLVGGPGVGKSTVACGLFSLFKQNRISSEYVSEYAKEITWEGTHKLLENQIHVFSEQLRRQYRLLDKVSYVITDSPLILNSVYFRYYIQALEKKNIKVPFSLTYQKLTEQFFDATFREFDNKTYFLQRSKHYDTNGRNQTLEEAIMLDEDIKQKLKDAGIKYEILTGNEVQNIDAIYKGVL